MAQFFSHQQQQAPNLQFYPSSYGNAPVSGHTTPSQAAYGGYGGQSAHGAAAYPGASGFNSGFGGPAGVSGRMGEQGGLRTGWLAAFGTEGYDGEPPLLEELGVNFGHIKGKVWRSAANVAPDLRQADGRFPTDARGPQPTCPGRSTYHG